MIECTGREFLAALFLPAVHARANALQGTVIITRIQGCSSQNTSSILLKRQSYDKLNLEVAQNIYRH